MITMFFKYLVLNMNVSPSVSLPVEIIEAPVDLLNISFLPLNIRAVFLEFGGHVVTAVFGCAQVLLCPRNY